jgi:hypothetical protein
MAQATKDTQEAFCATCPAVQDVTDWLQGYGFRLIFEMAAITSYKYTQMPPLPAQYHFVDRHNTEVIFLAGRDRSMDGQRYPPHASRWWISPGADQGVCQQVARALALRWSLDWQHSTADAHEDVA